METTEQRVGKLKPQILRSIALFGVYELEGPDYRRWVNLGGFQNGTLDFNTFMADGGFQWVKWADRDIYVIYRPPMRVQNIGEVEFWVTADNDYVLQGMSALSTSDLFVGGAAILPSVFSARLEKLRESRL